MSKTLLKSCITNNIVEFRDELKEKFNSTLNEKLEKIKSEIFKEEIVVNKDVVKDKKDKKKDNNNEMEESDEEDMDDEESDIEDEMDECSKKDKK